MKYNRLHRWNVSIHEAHKIQEKLGKRIVLGGKQLNVDKIAGVDVGYSNGTLTAAVCVFRWAEPGFNHLGLDRLEVKTATARVSFPYVPGLLTFREGPVILRAFRKIKNKPDVVLFDGQGICHPRRMGIATHMGIILDIPTVGCAKSSLCGVYEMPAKEKGSFSFIYDDNTREPGPCAQELGEKLGAVLRTRIGVKPVFVSTGYKIDLKQSVDLVLKTCPKFRIPEPLRSAHREANL